MMKTIVIFCCTALAAFHASAQIDTVKNGKVTQIDSAAGVSIAYLFKNYKLDGECKAYYLEFPDKLAFAGMFKQNQRQGVWNYYRYDQEGNQELYQFLTFVNDTLTGPSKIDYDSLVVEADYLKGEYNGKYKRYAKALDDSGRAVPVYIDSGEYRNGKAYGDWRIFKNGQLQYEGYYENGLRHRHWKEYDTRQRKGQLMREYQFFEDIITGKEIRHFYYRTDTCDRPGVSPCLDTVLVDEYEELPWQMGIISGRYLRKDAEGNVLLAGEYSENKKIGAWQRLDPVTRNTEKLTYLDDQLNGVYQLIANGKTIVQGTYAMNDKHKEWKYFDENGSVIRIENYEKGKKQGEWKYFSKDGKVGMLKVFADDRLVEVSEMNKYDEKVFEITIVYPKSGYPEMRITLHFLDSIIAYDAVYASDDNINFETFVDIFKNSGRDTSVFKLNGFYSVKKGAVPEYMGKFAMNVRHGNWDYYFNESIIWRQEFTNGLLTKEIFLNRSDQSPVKKGDYTLWYGPDRPKVEFRLREGLRDGKSVWYHPDGKAFKTEKYKDGVLQ
jgi:antitoxin component YwqK of YwqJK toxin-antitoxin module